MPEVVPEENKSDSDQISNASMNDNEQQISFEPKANADREHILVIPTNESPKNVLLYQLLQIVDCLSLPPQIIFDILKD